MAKVRKQFILDGAMIKRARKALGVQTDTEAVAQALSMVVANADIAAAHRHIVGRFNIKNMDQSDSK